MGRILIAKTSLDGHWRGVAVVARGLRDAGFEVVLGGMLRATEIAAMAAQEDVDLVGLNVGGKVDVVYRILDTLEEHGLGDVPVMAGGTIPPRDADGLEARNVAVFPPGSSMSDIVAIATKLVGGER